MALSFRCEPLDPSPILLVPTPVAFECIEAATPSAAVGQDQRPGHELPKGGGAQPIEPHRQARQPRGAEGVRAPPDGGQGSNPDNSRFGTRCGGMSSVP